jgi:uncharacterized protein DUF402
MPHWILEETPERVVLALVPGAQGRQPLGPRSEALQHLASDHWDVGDLPWHTNRVIRITSFDAAHAIELWWEHATNRFLFWKVNLQAPLRRTLLGFDSWDHLLDVLVMPDGSWSWKDEDELETAVGLGLFTAPEARAIRAEGERVIAGLERLIPTGWERWLPEPAWPALPLPDGWDGWDVERA